MSTYNEYKMIEQFERQFVQRFNFSMRQTIINAFQQEEYQRNKLIGLKALPLVGILEIVNEHIPNKLLVNYPTIVTKYRKEELAILRMIFSWVAFSAGFSNMETRELMQSNRTTILFQIKKMRHIIEYKHIYTDTYQLYLIILNKIATENERLLQCYFDQQPDTQSNLSVVFHPGSNHTGIYQRTPGVTLSDTGMGQSHYN